MAYTYNNLVGAYRQIGRPDQALAAAAEATKLWEELGNLPMLADIKNLFSLSNMMVGNFEAALESAAQGREIGELIDNPWSKLGSLPAAALVYTQKGEFASAFEIKKF